MTDNTSSNSRGDGHTDRDGALPSDRATAAEPEVSALRDGIPSASMRNQIANANRIAARMGAEFVPHAISERNLAYGLLWMMCIDKSDPNLNLASRARALLFQGMTKDDQRDGITRAIDLIPDEQARAVMELAAGNLVRGG